MLYYNQANSFVGSCRLDVEAAASICELIRVVCLVLSSQVLAVQHCCGVQWELPSSSRDCSQP